MVKFFNSLFVPIVLAGSIAGAGDACGTRTLVTTFFPIHVAVLNITAGVEGIRVVNLAAPSVGCLHDYSPTTLDLATLSKADGVVANGLGMESFLDVVKRRWPAIPVIEASAGIEPLVIGGVTNAHVWVSPARHIRQVQAIAERLAQWDPAHAAVYQKNAAAYCGRLEALRSRMAEALRGGRVRDIITFHEAFPYFADEFGLKVVAVIEREPGAEPSAGELAALIRQVRASGTKTLFVEPQYPMKAAEAIARETGASVLVLDPVVSGLISTNAYLSAMERNFEVLRQALK